MAEQGREAKAEADRLDSEANKKVIYERIEACLSEYGTCVRSYTSTMAWFKSGRKAVQEMLADQATAAGKKKAAKKVKKADEFLVPETSSEDEASESESEAEDSEEDPPPGGYVCGFV